MTYLAIVAWTTANRVAKFQDYDTGAEATAHVDRVKGDFPDAFVSQHPGSGGVRDWLVDPVAKTLSVDPVIDPPPETDKQRAERLLKSDPVWRASVNRELAKRKAAGETTLTVQRVIDEYTGQL